MQKKLLISSLFIMSVFILTGCGGGSGSTQTIGFGTYSTEISEEFVSVPAGLVENKQIINKVLRSYKIDNPEGYDKNIVITQSTINPSLNYEQFATVNEQKLLKQLVGYTPGAKEIIPFTCGDDSIQGILTSFTVTDTFYQGMSTYYVHQYQFVANEQGYIISYATDIDDEEKLFKSIIKSLECNQ